MSTEFEGLPLFAAPAPEPTKIRLIDPKVRGTEEEPRLSNQCAQILERLRQGHATNSELAGISLKYTGRISDLRQSGFDIQVIQRDRKSGVTVYELKAEPQRQTA